LLGCLLLVVGLPAAGLVSADPPPAFFLFSESVDDFRSES